MTTASRKGHRFGWILLVCGVVSFAAAIIFVVVAIQKGWSVESFFRALSSLLLGVFWVLLYRRGLSSPSASEESQPGPN